MPGNRRLSPQWRDDYRQTVYPFGDGSRLRSRTGVQLPVDLLEDASLYPIGRGSRIYLSELRVSGDRIVFVLGDELSPQIASGQSLLTQPQDVVEIFDTLNRPAGVLVSTASRLLASPSWGLGSHVFDISQTTFAASCVIPSPEVGLQGLRLDDGTVVFGEAWLIGDDGVVLSTTTEEVPAVNGQEAYTRQILRADLVGDPLYRRRLCDPQALFTTPRPVRGLRIVNGARSFVCYPDDYGNMQIQANNFLTERPSLRLCQNAAGLVLQMEGSLLTGDAHVTE